jgi:hypothetical protein
VADVSQLVTQLVTRIFREYMLAQLPAKVTEVNADRAPVLKAARAGPYTITGTKKLSISQIGIDTGYVDSDAFTVGSQTATQLAATINASAGLAGVASSDTEGRLLLTGSAPTGAANTIIAAKDAATGAGTSALFGWESSGERVIRAPLVAPLYKGVANGLPYFPDMGPGFWLIIGRRMCQPVVRAGSSIRTFEYQVGFELGLMYRETNIQSHRDREGIESVVRCVRELLLTESGRQLGRGGPAPLGDIVLVEEKQCTVEGTPFQFQGDKVPAGIFDRALMLLSVRVFERAPT